MDTDEKYFQALLRDITALRIKKDMDYGSSWKEMRGIGITDIIAVKVNRIKSFEDKGELNFESVHDSLWDIVNYCLFRIYKLTEEKYEKEGKNFAEYLNEEYNVKRRLEY